MSTNNRVGIRAARALLSLVEENSAEEFEAAESILGSEKELINILQLLRKYKEHEEEPLTVARLREIVRQEVLDLHLSTTELNSIVSVLFSGKKVRSSVTSEKTEERIDQLIDVIEGISPSPGQLVEGLVELLILSAEHQGSETELKFFSLLRDLAAQALAENRLYFPTLHALAQLRTGWAEAPLPYKHQEPRQSLTRRLVKDIALIPSNERQIKLIRGLLREGLRTVVDAEIAELNRMKPKKAKGE